MGEPLKYAGLNTVGLTRRGFESKALSSLKKAYKVLYRENLTTEQAIQSIDNDFEHIPEINHLIEFLKGCERGIIR